MDTVTSRPTRVLIVYQHLPHYRYDVFRLLEDEPSVQVEFAAAAQSRDGSIPTIPSRALRVVHVVRNRWCGRMLWQSGLLGLLVRTRPDTVIFLGDAAYLSTWLGALGCRLSGIQVLFWTHGWVAPDSGVKRIVRLTFYHLADKLLLYGETARAIGKEMGFPLGRMVVIYNSSSGPIPEQTVAATAPHRAARPPTLSMFLSSLPPADRPVVTAVIRLNPSKRLDLLIEAAAVLRARGLTTDVLLVGEGPALAGLKEQARALGVRLYAPGPAYDDAALNAVYCVSDVTVVPSIAGLTVLQSLKFGCPVITHDNIYAQMPESEAIIPGTTGSYYSFGNAESLADSISEWVSRPAKARVLTSLECKASITERWSPEAQHLRIISEIRNPSTNQRGA